MIGLEVSSGVTRILICGNSRGQSYYIAFIHEKMSQLAQLVFIFKFRYNVCSRFLCKCDSADGKVVARKKRLQFASDYSKKSNSCLQQHRLHNTYATCAVARPRRCLFTNRTIINGCNLRSDPPPALRIPSRSATNCLELRSSAIQIDLFVVLDWNWLPENCPRPAPSVYRCGRVTTDTPRLTF